MKTKFGADMAQPSHAQLPGSVYTQHPQIPRDLSEGERSRGSWEGGSAPQKPRIGLLIGNIGRLMASTADHLGRALARSGLRGW